MFSCVLPYKYRNMLDSRVRRLPCAPPSTLGLPPSLFQISLPTFFFMGWFRFPGVHSIHRQQIGFFFFFGTVVQTDGSCAATTGGRHNPVLAVEDDVIAADIAARAAELCTCGYVPLPSNTPSRFCPQCGKKSKKTKAKKGVTGKKGVSAKNARNGQGGNART